MSSLPVLVLNSGSSSIKFAIYEAGGDQRDRLFEGAVDGIGTDLGKFWIKDATGRKLVDQTPALPTRAVAFRLVADALRRDDFPTPAAIGHRMVCGGPTVLENQLHHAGADRRDGALHRVCAAAHAHRRLHHAAGAGVVSRRPQLRLPRFLLPSHHATSGAANAHPGGILGDGRAAFRRAWNLLRVDRLPAWVERAGEAGGGAPGKRRVHHGHPQRTLPGYVDGTHTHGRHYQRHAHGRHRSRRAAVHPAQDCRNRQPTPPTLPTSWRLLPARRPACWA